MQISICIDVLLSPDNRAFKFSFQTYNLGFTWGHIAPKKRILLTTLILRYISEYHFADPIASVICRIPFWAIQFEIPISSE